MKLYMRFVTVIGLFLLIMAVRMYPRLANEIYNELFSEPEKFHEVLRVYGDEINRYQILYNRDKFVPIDNNTLVIAVQVHDRLDYLRELISSLNKSVTAHGNALIIFSQDYWDVDISAFIRSIKFCRVMQIYFPHSRQAYPDQFPDDSPKDCYKHFDAKKFPDIQCLNRNHSDKYGHYRQAKFSQIKHHWWWKANFVFKKLKILEKFEGRVLFLEEDLIASDDLVHVYQLLHGFQDYPRAEIEPILSLGMMREMSYSVHGDEVLLVPSAPVNLAMNRRHWENILQCKNEFCKFDDYNWDMSLNHVFYTCQAAKMNTLMLTVPRLIHNGLCGVHFKKNDCHSKETIRARLQKLEPKMFPERLKLNKHYKRAILKQSPWGGWGDIRDHQLCLSIAEES